MKKVMSNRTDAAAETNRRMTLTDRPQRRRALAVIWLMSILFCATLQTAAANETAKADPHTRMLEADWVMDAWRTYQSKFISPEGRVIDDANGGISPNQRQGRRL